VTLFVDASKARADSIGSRRRSRWTTSSRSASSPETPAPLAGETLYLKQHRIRAGKQRSWSPCRASPRARGSIPIASSSSESATTTSRRSRLAAEMGPGIERRGGDATCRARTTSSPAAYALDDGGRWGYSARSATVGCTRNARRVGTMHASMQTPNIIAA
jgi:hypothetical protein